MVSNSMSMKVIYMSRISQVKPDEQYNLQFTFSSLLLQVIPFFCASYISFINRLDHSLPSYIHPQPGSCRYTMKFIYASLLSALVSAVPITEDKRQLSNAGGSPTEALGNLVNSLSGATSLINGIGLKHKRADIENIQARQLGDVTGLVDQLVGGLLGGSSGSSGGLLEGLNLRRDNNGEFDKRQLDAVTDLLQGLLGGLLGGGNSGGDSGGLNVKRDVEDTKRQLDEVSGMVHSLLGGLLGGDNGGGLLDGLNLKRDELDGLESRQLDGVTALVQGLVGGLVGGQGRLLGGLNLNN